MACNTLAVEICQKTQDVDAVLDQCSIRIQHQHMREVLGTQQVLIEHPEATLPSRSVNGIMFFDLPFESFVS